MITDVNVSLSRWPFRRLPYDALPKLVAKLKEHGISEAWVNSYDGLLHRDVAAVNQRLAAACRDVPGDLLQPFGTVNPKLPDWREDLRRCDEDFRMPGIRLHPNYHGYGLDDLACVELFQMAARRGMLIQIALRMEDPRTHHPLMQVPDVDIRPLANLLNRVDTLRIVLLNGMQVLDPRSIQSLVATRRVYFDLATLEGLSGITRALQRMPVESLLFGSHFPLFVLESALLKLRESELSREQLDAIRHGNAEKLISDNG